MGWQGGRERAPQAEKDAAWSFAQEILGIRVSSGARERDYDQSAQELCDWLADIAPRQAAKRRGSEYEPRDIATREQLRVLASYSARHAEELRRLEEAEVAAERRRDWLERFWEAWDPAKHPRLGAPPNAGWFASKGGGTASANRTEIKSKDPPHETWADASNVGDAEKRPVSGTRGRFPAAHRGEWVSGSPGEGTFRYHDSAENRKAGVAGKEVRYKGNNISIGGLPPEVYYKGDARAATVEIPEVLGTDADMSAADAEMRKKLNDPKWQRPKGYLWNHAGPPGSKVMELVDKDLHRSVAHRGPAAEPRALDRTTRASKRKGGIKGSALGALDVYLTARDALQAAGVLQPDYEVEKNEVYHFADEDGSVFVVQERGWSGKSQRKFVSGPKKGQSEEITDEDVEQYRQQAEREWGKYDPGSLIREPKFIPGTKRKSIPYFEYRNGVRFEVGWIDQEGIHHYAVPRGPIL